MLSGLQHDFEYSLRMLKRSPQFTAFAVLILALGFGANTAIFSLFNAALLRPMPGISEAGRLVSVYRVQNGQMLGNFGYPDYLDYQRLSHSISGLAAHVGSMMVFRSGSSDRVRGDVVTGNYFSVLGAQAELGRLLNKWDDRAVGANPVAVLSYGFWQRRLGADPKIIGKTIQLNGYPFVVVGVAAPGFRGTVTGEVFDVWIPMSMLAQGLPGADGRSWYTNRSFGWLLIFGRLTPGGRLEQAEAELRTIAGQLQKTYPETNTGRTLVVERGVGIEPDDRSDLVRLLLLLFAAVGLLLLLTCANLANLLLARSTGRQREIAVRQALGETRRRLVRQLLLEGLLLSAFSAVAGLFIGRMIIALTESFRSSSAVLNGLDIGIDVRVLGFAVLLSIVTAVLFALAPAISSSKTDLTTALKQGLPGSGSRSLHLQGLLVCGQVAISLILLIGSGLVLRTMQNIVDTKPGFDTEHLALLSLDLTIQGYNEQQGKSSYERLLERVRGIPGVQSAGLAKSVPPIDWNDKVSLFYPGHESSQQELRKREFETRFGTRVVEDRISPGYLESMGIPLLRGRDFRTQDTNESAGVAIISRKLGQELWPGQDVIGKRISWPTTLGPPRPPLEIVGLVGDAKQISLTGDPTPLFYVPVLQEYDGRATLVVRTAADPASMTETVRRAIHEMDPNLAVFGVQTMEQHINRSLWVQRLVTTLISGFGFLALGLAALGLYGIVAYSVTQRTREIGIRIALGAQSQNVLALILHRAMLLTGTGVVIGLAGAYWMGRLLTGFLYGIQPTDSAALGLATLVLFAVGLFASYLPARHATKVNPVVSLRCD